MCFKQAEEQIIVTFYTLNEQQKNHLNATE